MVRRLASLGCALAWLASVPAWAQTGADSAEVAEVLTELDEAGSPATAREIAEFLKDAAPQSQSGVLLGRTGWTGTDGLEHTARLRLDQGWLTLRGRWRQYRDGSVQIGGAGMFGPDRWQLAVGQLGLSQGFGLLAGGPGRGPSLTADGSLRARGDRMVLWTGAAEPQTIRGVGAALKLGLWQVRTLAGQRGDEPLADQQTVVTQVSAGNQAWRLSGVVLVDPAEKGASLSGRLRRGAVDASWEAVWRRPVGSPVPLGGLLVQGGWRPHRVARLEVLAGWAAAGPRPVLGQKHPVLGAWGGRGAAVRGTWRADSGLGVKLMIHRGHGREPVLAGDRRLRTLADAQLTQNWAGGWSAAARWRQGGEEVTAWSERFPWQPPALAWQDSRRVVSLKGQWSHERSRAQVLWRQLDLARVRQDSGWQSGGARSLVTFSGAVSLGQSALLRAAWTVSWGDPVDLVSAVVPFAGYVLPRHWGHWRAERLVGLQWSGGGLQLRSALSWRQAEPQLLEDPVKDAWAAWLEIAWVW
ncbi:MAG: hypothetical protein QNL91_00725 [Candidatus Krumholzibacteria bacterium]|nr:hypothetical protein [Candidatus Krumholzibacteria bacterium]